MKVLCTTLCTYVSYPYNLASPGLFFLIFTQTYMRQVSGFYYYYYFFLVSYVRYGGGRGGYTFFDEKKSQLFFFFFVFWVLYV